MPCTELWLAVSSCVESPWHQPRQLQHSATPSSSPAEVAGPVCGPPGQPGHHQTSLEEQPGHILGTLEVPQFRARQPSLPWVPPRFPCSPCIPAARVHTALRLLDQPVPAAVSPALGVELYTLLPGPVQNPFPGLPGSPPLPPHSMPAAGTLCPPVHWGNYSCLRNCGRPGRAGGTPRRAA